MVRAWCVHACTHVQVCEYLWVLVWIHVPMRLSRYTCTHICNCVCMHASVPVSWMFFTEDWVRVVYTYVHTNNQKQNVEAHRNEVVDACWETLDCSMLSRHTMCSSMASSSQCPHPGCGILVWSADMLADRIVSMLRIWYVIWIWMCMSARCLILNILYVMDMLVCMSEKCYLGIRCASWLEQILS